MAQFDPGPPPEVADHFDKVPSYAPHRDLFWYDWGPIFYRGRLDRSARLLCVASDPGPTERIAGRTLVGDAGQRVQGFISKLGLTHSYACVNAYAYALLPSRSMSAIPILSGVPSWLGDDSRGRTSRPKRRNTVERDPADLLHTLIWRAPAV